MKKAFVLLIVILLLQVAIVNNQASAFSKNQADSWTFKEQMPTKRMNFGVAAVDGKIYVIGGEFANSFFSTTEMYDPQTDKWTTKAAMPTPRSCFGIAAVNGKIYVIGGHNYTNPYLFTAKIEVYNPTTDKWETKTPIPTPRGEMDANAVDGKIYVISGLSKYGRSNVTEVYDTETDSWATKASIPNSVSVYGSAVANNKIYLIGGYNGSANVNFNQIYNPLTDRWHYGASIPFAVCHAGIGATTGFLSPARIYVIGGLGSQKEETNPYILNGCVQNQVYNLEKDAWTAGAVLPESSFGVKVAVVDDILYAIGGPLLFYFIQALRFNQQYIPVGYGTLPPTISLTSPRSDNYSSAESISLNFTVNREVAWLAYSLNGQRNVTITGNCTLSALPSGLHNITVFAKDAFENVGSSETITFSRKEPFPTVLAVAVALGIIIAIGIIFLIYVKKRNQSVPALEHYVP